MYIREQSGRTVRGKLILQLPKKVVDIHSLAGAGLILLNKKREG